MSEIDTLTANLKKTMSGAWRRLFGSSEDIASPTPASYKAAAEESGKAVREVFSRKGAAVQKNTPKTVADAGVRSLSASELHKNYELSRSGKVAAAFNTTAAAVWKDGNLDILRGGVYHG